MSSTLLLFFFKHKHTKIVSCCWLYKPTLTLAVPEFINKPAGQTRTKRPRVFFSSPRALVLLDLIIILQQQELTLTLCVFKVHTDEPLVTLTFFFGVVPILWVSVWVLCYSVITICRVARIEAIKTEHGSVISNAVMCCWIPLTMGGVKIKYTLTTLWSHPF